jgi:hypothetical protein
MFQRSGHRICFLWVLLGASGGLLEFSASAQQTTLHLRNGDRISGVIVSETTNGVVITNLWTPQMVIPPKQILRRETGPPASAANTGMAVAVAPAVPTTNAPPGAPKRRVLTWAGEVQLGADLGFSEKNRQLYTGRAKVTMGYHRMRNLFDYSFSYGRSEGIVSANRMDGSLKTDYDLSRRLYVYNLGGVGYDEIRKIDFRYETGPGLGYHLVRRTNFLFKTEAGVNYQAQYRTDGSQSELFFFRFAEEAGWKITPRLSFDEKFEFFPQVEDFSEFRFRFESNLRYALMNNLFFTVTVLDQYDSDPALGVSPNDLQVRSTIGVKF